MRVLGQGVPTGQEAERLIEELRGVDLFTPLSIEQLRKLLFFIKTVEFDAGEVVFEKGEDGNWFFLIRTGAIEVYTPGFFGVSVVANMGPGEFFGELALLLGQPRSASVRATEETVCLALDRTDLELLMERSPDIAVAIKRIAQQRFAS